MSTHMAPNCIASRKHTHAEMLEDTAACAVLLFAAAADLGSTVDSEAELDDDMTLMVLTETDDEVSLLLLDTGALDDDTEVLTGALVDTVARLGGPVMVVHDALLVLGNGRPMLRVMVGMAMSDMFADVGLAPNGWLMYGKVEMGKLSDTP